jgi:hypothetical protein
VHGLPILFILILPFDYVRLISAGRARIIIYSACFLLISGMPEEYVSNATAVGTTTRFWTTAIGYA